MSGGVTDFEYPIGSCGHAVQDRGELPMYDPDTECYECGGDVAYGDAQYRAYGSLGKQEMVCPDCFDNKMDLR